MEPCGSLSINNVRNPRSARQRAIVMAVVVLPTPPFWLPIMSLIIAAVPRGYSGDRPPSIHGIGYPDYASVPESGRPPACGTAFGDSFPGFWRLGSFDRGRYGLFFVSWSYIQANAERGSAPTKRYDTNEKVPNKRHILMLSCYKAKSYDMATLASN